MIDLSEHTMCFNLGWERGEVCMTLLRFHGYTYVHVTCRCVLNWFGDWSTGALYQVGYEFTNKVDLDKSDVS